MEQNIIIFYFDSSWTLFDVLQGDEKGNFSNFFILSEIEDDATKNSCIVGSHLATGEVSVMVGQYDFPQLTSESDNDTRTQK